MTTIKTKRLILRPWQESDWEPFATLNADAKVMEYFPSPLSKENSDNLARQIQKKMEERGYGLWAVTIPEVADFIGFIGLNNEDNLSFPAHFTPAIEIGWRLASQHWGKGYATEGAQAVLTYAFETLKLKEIVSFTATQNMRSRRIMEKIGMHHDSKEDFDHPKLPEGHPLRRHVLYRVNEQKWRQNTHIKNKYVYKPYSKIFPELFQNEKKRIFSFLKNALAIEHVGSTSISNLGGKGIIDIAILVKKEEMNHACTTLQNLGYEFRPSFSTSNRFYFVTYLADKEEGSRRYHIHLLYSDSNEWSELIGFRDYLRAHPEAAEEYANIKKHAATLANQDGHQYREMKEPIFKKIKALTKESYGKNA